MPVVPLGFIDRFLHSVRCQTGARKCVEAARENVTLGCAFDKSLMSFKVAVASPYSRGNVLPKVQ